MSKTIMVRGSDITMHSPYLSTTDIYKFLSSSSSKNDKPSHQAFSINNFKEALSGINSSFYPTATIKIDTLKHDTLDVTDFNLNFLFNSKGDLQLQDTQLNFYGGTLEMDVDAAITTTDKLPVKIDLHLKDIDLQELVSRLDYFDSEDLRNDDKVAGMLNININATGNVNDTGTLDMSSLNGTFKLDIANLELHNFKPIMENSVLMKDQRFARLSFRPIVQTFKISDGELIIPRTEIQSSAIQIFAEGRLKFNEYLNIWLSIPWKNLKSNDGLTLPEKTTYAQAGSKFYIQLLQNKSEKKEKNRDLKVKFRLSNRKLRKMKSKN